MIHLLLFILTYDPEKEANSTQMTVIYPNWHMQKNNTKVYKQSKTQAEDNYMGPNLERCYSVMRGRRL